MPKKVQHKSTASLDHSSLWSHNETAGDEKINMAKQSRCPYWRRGQGFRKERWRLRPLLAPGAHQAGVEEPEKVKPVSRAEVSIETGFHADANNL